MGRKRLIVQADLTSEEDQAFMAWVKQKIRRRRLAEEIRQGLLLRYRQARGQAEQAYPLLSTEEDLPVERQGDNSPDQSTRGSSCLSSKLARLVQSL